MSAFRDVNGRVEKKDTWEDLLPSSPRHAEPECSNEKLEISRLKDEITALKDALKEKNATLRTSMFSHKHLPTLTRLKKQGGSRRFRKHKRSAARRGTASRRKYKNRK